jgi:hypothetical protein
MIDLEESRRLRAAGTQGEWTLPFEDGAIVSSDSPLVSLLGLDVGGMAVVQSRKDAELIAHAVNILPIHCAEIERLRAELATAIKAMEKESS